MSALTTVGSIWPITLEGNSRPLVKVATHTHLYELQYSTMVCFICGESASVINARREREERLAPAVDPDHHAERYTPSLLQVDSFDDYA